jgi:hypothetical protein
MEGWHGLEDVVEDEEGEEGEVGRSGCRQSHRGTQRSSVIRDSPLDATS